VAGKRNAAVILIGLLMVMGWGFDSIARGQAVAFVPGIGAIPSGETLTVTPAVSADRRYVRLSVNAEFNALIGFTNFPVQGAVGGGGGAGAFGGLAGMNGVVGQGGFAGAGGMGTGASFGLSGESLAGPLPFADGFADLGPPPFKGDPLNPTAAPGPNAWSAGDEAGDQAGELAEPEPAFQKARNGRGVRAANQPAPRQRRASPRKSSRRRSPAALRPSR
jgi:hypothetical protein